MGRPRKLKDPRPAASLDSFTALMNATLQATLPCRGGTEWWSDDPMLQARAAALCRACQLLDPCLVYSLAAGERKGVWGGTTPLDRKRFRHKAAA